MRAIDHLLIVGLLSAFSAQMARSQVPGMPSEMRATAARNEAAMAACLGMPLEEYRAATNPTGGELRSPTSEERKAQDAALKKLNKIPRDKQMQCNQQVMMGSMGDPMAMAGQMMGGAGAKAALAGGRTEAPGKRAVLSEDLESDLKGGKTALRDIDWLAGKAELSSEGAEALEQALLKLGPALKEAGGNWRLDFFMDEHYDDETAAMAAEARYKVLSAGLTEAAGEGAPGFRLGKVKRDKDPRVELVMVK